MGIYLKIGSTDVSRFITENKYSISVSSVYDNGGEFVNIYGAKVRERRAMRWIYPLSFRTWTTHLRRRCQQLFRGRNAAYHILLPRRKQGNFSARAFRFPLTVFTGEKSSGRLR